MERGGGGHKAEYAQEKCVRSAQRLGGSGGMPPQEILEFSTF